jgi:hypothetical protein
MMPPTGKLTLPRPVGAPRSYNTNGGEITAKGYYKIDKAKLEPELKLNARTWKVKVSHEVSKEDKLTALFVSDNVGQPTLTYTRTQGDVELSLSAPVCSDIRANASISVKRTFDL